MIKFQQQITFTVVTSATGTVWSREVLRLSLSISDEIIFILMAILLVFRNQGSLFVAGLVALGEVKHGVAQKIREYSLYSCPAVAIIG